MKEIALSAPQDDIANSPQQVNLFLAGQGSGKTHVAGIVSYGFISAYPKVRGLIAANTYSQLNRSTVFRIREVWKEYFNVTEYNDKTKKGDYVISKKPPATFTSFYQFDTYANIISFRWGAVVYIGSLDNYKALDGMEIGWSILDETKDTREEAVKEVITGRLRQRGVYVSPEGELHGEDEKNDQSIEFNPLYIFTSPAKVPWINDWFNLEDLQEDIKRTIYFPPDYFLADIGNKRVTISATHLNADNLPQNYISNQEANLSKELQNMLIYGDPFSKAGGEFYKGFDRQMIVEKGLKAKYYTPEKVLHLTFDFNVSPYITLNIWIGEGKTAVQIDEICLESPKNSTPAICQEFRKKYNGHKGGIFIYGDPAGRQRDTRGQGQNDYTIIFAQLRDFKPQDRVDTKAPPVNMRGQFINSIFEQNIYGIEILIDDSCRHSIGDYLYLKEAPDGTKAKIKEKDSNGVMFEKYGHTSDANDYFICKYFAADWYNFLRGGSSGNVSVPKRGDSRKRY